MNNDLTTEKNTKSQTGVVQQQTNKQKHKELVSEEDVKHFKISTFALHQEGKNQECKGLLPTEDCNQAISIVSIECLVYDILKLQEDIFYIGKIASGISAKFIACKNKDKDIFNKMYRYSIHGNNPISQIVSSFPVHQFNPYVELFIKNFYKKIDHIDLKTSYLCQNSEHAEEIDKELQKVVDALNNFIDSIKTEASSNQFKTKLYEHQRLINNNYKSLIAYIDNIFTRHSRLLVIRIDLGYKRNVDTRFLNESEIYDKYWQVKTDREHFFNNMRSNTLFDDMLGYAWKLEYAARKGFHYHMLFFYDGSKVEKDIIIARMIGEYWAKVITKGEGLYFNCNAQKDKYEHPGIGMINHHDAELMANLKNKVAPYLTKPDYYARVVIQENDKNRVIKGRTFGRSEMKPKVTKRGRPRKNTTVKASLPLLVE